MQPQYTQVPLESPEEWRPVVGFEGFYEVSDLGRVRRIAPRKTRDRPTGTLKQSIRSSGYFRVLLYRNKEYRNALVHRIVASAFWGPTKPGQWTNHLNGNKLDNRAVNLEWCTPSENLLHAIRTGLRPNTFALINPTRTGSRNPSAKLTEADVIAIRALRPTMTLTSLAKQHGVSYALIGQICRREIWKHI